MLLPDEGIPWRREAPAILVLDDDTVRNGYRIISEEGTVGLERDLYKGGTLLTRYLFAEESGVGTRNQFNPPSIRMEYLYLHSVCWIET
ncbi:MAG: hypothetical protein RLZZ165_2430 [Bacteroidota bacterium]